MMHGVNEAVLGPLQCTADSCSARHCLVTCRHNTCTWTPWHGAAWPMFEAIVRVIAPLVAPAAQVPALRATAGFT
jgi:hypothetical protein